ncbi:MAG: serine protease [Bacteroidota bacterium]
MKTDIWQDIVVQIATSYTREGTGFYIPQYGLVVTHEQTVSDHGTAIIGGADGQHHLATVIFADTLNDLAFLKVADTFQPQVDILTFATHFEKDTPVTTIGHPFGDSLRQATGQLQEIEEEGQYLRHNAVLPDTYNGSLLLNSNNEILGMSTFAHEGNATFGLALSGLHIENIIKEYLVGKGQKGVRCLECSTITFEPGKKLLYCSNCGAKVTYLSTIKAYEPIGVAKTIEDIITRIGHEVKLARRAPNNWEIQEGSAKVVISYHEDSGLITGDAYLCLLPKNNLKDIYQFLLQQNKTVERLTFSLHPNGQEIILSLLIYDRYLNVDIGMQLFQHLLERADYFDNVLVEEYGASWTQPHGAGEGR